MLLLTEGQVSDYKRAATMLPVMPQAPVLIGDRGYDANLFHQALRSRGIRPCIPGRKGRSQAIRHGKQLYRCHHKIENMFGKLKDWRRVATRYDRCAHTFISAITIAAIVLFWLPRCEP
jgi:putative transposase